MANSSTPDRQRIIAEPRGTQEISELGWFTPPQLSGADLNRFTRALLRATGYLAT